MSQTAYQRIEPRLKALAPDLEIITLVNPGTFRRDGREIDTQTVAPDIAWVSHDMIASGLLPAMFARLLQSDGLQWIQIPFAGLDHPIFKQIMAKGSRLTKSSAQAIPIAEYVLSHALSLIAPINAQRDAQARQEWRTTPYREIGQTRWTLIGFGSIGKAIAQRLKPFGCHLTIVRRAASPDPLADAVVVTAALPDVLPQCDVVVLAVALNEQTRNMVDDRFFAAMKPHSILINIARGALIDEEALKRGLERDQPGWAVLDTFTTEPLPPSSWMWRHPKIRVSAHTSHAGNGTPGRGDDLFLGNLKLYLAGDALLNEASRSEVGL